MATGNGNNGVGIALRQDAQQMAQALREADPQLAQRMVEIVLSRPVNKPLSAQRALAAALRERSTGETEGRDFFADENMGIVPGYTGEQRAAGKRAEIMARPRLMTTEELALHKVQPADEAMAYEVWEIERASMCRAAGIPYTPIIGIGIVREHEMFSSSEWNEAARRKLRLPRDKWTPIEPPVGRSWHWKAEIRAYKDALRRTPGMEKIITAGDILTMAEEEGLEMPPENARLSRDQALRWLDDGRKELARKQEREAMTPEQLERERAQRLAASQERQARRAADDAEWERLMSANPNRKPEAPAWPNDDMATPTADDDPPDPAPVPAKATEAQLNTLDEAYRAVYTTDDTRKLFAGWLQTKYRVNLPSDLTPEQADEVITKLQAHRPAVQPAT